jgi:hypothetical protein
MFGGRESGEMRRLEDRKRKNKIKSRKIILLIGKIIFSILLALGTFICVLLTFSRFLGWPTTLSTLGITLFVAWLVSGIVSGKFGRAGPAVAAVLAVGLAVSSALFGVPWRGPKAVVWHRSENYYFFVEAWFIAENTATGEKVENIVIGLPRPHVDNEFLRYTATPHYSLYWFVDGVQQTHLQAGFSGEEEPHIPFRAVEGAPRKEPLKVKWGINRSFLPGIVFELSELYPDEVLYITFYATTYAEDGMLVTVREESGTQVLSEVAASFEDVTMKWPGENYALLYYGNGYVPENTVPIDLRFTIRMWRKIGGEMGNAIDPDSGYELVEHYAPIEWENVAFGIELTSLPLPLENRQFPS